MLLYSSWLIIVIIMTSVFYLEQKKNHSYLWRSAMLDHYVFTLVKHSGRAEQWSCNDE